MDMRLSNYSVNAKVIAAFVCVLVATIGLGVFANYSVHLVNLAAQELGQRNVPKTQQLAGLRYNSTRFRAEQGAALLAPSPEARAGSMARMAEARALVSGFVSRVVKSAENEAERTNAQKISDAWSAYTSSADRMLEISASQGAEAANTYYVTDMQAQFDTLRGLVTAGLDYHKAEAAVIAKHSHDTYEFANIGSYAVMGVAILFALVAGYVLSRSVSRPLIDLSGVMKALAHGKMETIVPFAGDKDEVGELASAMADFRDQLVTAQREKDEQCHLIVSSVGAGLEQLAAGNLTHRIDVALNGPFAKVKDDFNAAISHLEGTMTRITGHSHQITGSSSEISDAADHLSRRTEQQAASLEETAAAMEEITETVKRTAANSRDVNNSIAAASADAEEGGRVVEAAITAMDAISNSSGKITDIIGVIDEIAFQTNLLALNAGVEAARAGDAGRGFAVVASEVRALAQRSSEAAKQIKALINASSGHVQDGVHLVGESGRALVRIVEQVQHIAAVVREMTGATEHQSTGIEEVNAAVGQMDQMTQQNAAMYEQSTAAAKSLSQEIQALDAEISFFKIGHAAHEHQRSEPAPKQAPSSARLPSNVASLAARPRRASVGGAAAW